MDANKKAQPTTNKMNALAAQWNELIDARLEQLEKGLSDPAVLSRGKDAQASFRSNTAKKQRELRLVRRLINGEPLTQADTAYLVSITSDKPITQAVELHEGDAALPILKAHNWSIKQLEDKAAKVGLKLSDDYSKLVKA